MDMIFPLAKTGAISASTNLWLAIPIGFVFGFALFHAGFTDSRRIAWAFYFKHVGVPVVMFSAIVTGMLGLWGLSLIGVLDISQVYMLPTFLLPMAVGGVIFGIGMVVGGYCPGTAAAAVATGKIDGAVFIVGFLIGSLVFGDFFPVWGDFFNSDYMGAFRLDQALSIGLGPAVLGVVVIAVGGGLGMRWVQKKFWPETETEPRNVGDTKLQGGLIAVALVIALTFAFFPTDSFIDDTVETPYYIVPRADTVAAP
ncbi:MAG: YeeE/YedE family protein [Gammaproteobacteria bacterium]|nr:YeeE/YedE family protein [Gammaproteobacteria bacterium]NNF48950.1 YeeE/YedE family protein [Woeseiaceae bacterium]MBT8094879.1 YeeE/YedE family protein [Gammaproteobacteria bacterium]MBT8106132.1 YeeE/YedE family protein [Gammaproteobacteria bacterium]NNK26146.1 YeeE/YedE family protein [Woeseiaceae bacterium]